MKDMFLSTRFRYLQNKRLIILLIFAIFLLIMYKVGGNIYVIEAIASFLVGYSLSILLNKFQKVMYMDKGAKKIEYLIETGKVVKDLNSIKNKFKFYILGYVLIDNLVKK